MVQDETSVQLATRVPKALHRELKVHCVTSDATVMEFVVAAIEEKLGRKAKVSRAVRGRK
jgi:hypothetical protein